MSKSTSGASPTTETPPETMEAFAERFAREFSAENGVSVTAEEVLESLRRDEEKRQRLRMWQHITRHENPYYWIMGGR